MAMSGSIVGARVCYGGGPAEMRVGSGEAGRRRMSVVVRAEGGGINPEIRKNEEKVVDSVVVTELSKNITPYCRCWRSGTFPLCDGSHMKHNKATGDNVGPLLLKKQ
ncbi:PREDICTED: CDGSH iron-sulfur domain-containing protein NEET [Tarenaya hassleriana]|uniref:CDGSH iron-sulfur domain-containing protein NEET n=1 Tax=Tarenaya hassleriana TaxID=28532 RepID=UPI00053C2D40|nr:PREDICTED: CDGSH iron-sulfur domain-containing protein NEET [Tarenaya hassleriana]